MDTGISTVTALLSAALPSARIECHGTDQEGRQAEAWQAESAKFSATMPLSDGSTATLAALLTAAGCTGVVVSEVMIAMSCPGSLYTRQRLCRRVAGHIGDQAITGLTTLRFEISAEEQAALDRNFRRMVEAADRASEAGGKKQTVPRVQCQNPSCETAFIPKCTEARYCSQTCFRADRKRKAAEKAKFERKLTTRERRALASERRAAREAAA